ncbi:MAG: hypothetical protein M3Q69_07880 [Acidobacteriota bacterium]|nr:hypothetical protein [Acidobacteriota bacterium]
MKKLTVWALLATLVVAGSAFAVPRQVVADATFATGSPATTNNDDSCDIGVAPAATLLLPYFEVDLASRTGEQTIFTITNVSPVEQIAHVTLWTDLSYPVIDFNIYLTGYDVQSINLYDVIALGQIAPTEGTGFDDPGSPEGDFSGDNPLVLEASCANLPMQLNAVYIQRMRQAFTVGSVPALGTAPACTNIGSSQTNGLNPNGRRNANAIGYATIDVASRCGTQLPSDPAYFTAGGEALFDNVLIGDYQQINSAQNFAQGNPMVHIRAVPEGGVPGSGLATNLPRTFYSRYQAALTPRADRRQPLPATFAARFINGGTGSFDTFYKIWREGSTTGAAACTGAGVAVNPNNITNVTELVTFDEQENARGTAPAEGPVSPPINLSLTMPETGLYNFNAAADLFPRPAGNAVAGWVYMNLANSTTGPVSQNWVVVSMRAEGRYSVDFDAAWLGNGCSPRVARSEVEPGGTAVIGPAPNFTTYP